VLAIQGDADHQATLGGAGAAVLAVGIVRQGGPVQAGAGRQREPAAGMPQPVADPLGTERHRFLPDHRLFACSCLDGLTQARQQRQVGGDRQVGAAGGFQPQNDRALVLDFHTNPALLRAVGERQFGLGFDG